MWWTRSKAASSSSSGSGETAGCVTGEVPLGGVGSTVGAGGGGTIGTTGTSPGLCIGKNESDEAGACGSGRGWGARGTGLATGTGAGTGGGGRMSGPVKLGLVGLSGNFTGGRAGCCNG